MKAKNFAACFIGLLISVAVCAQRKKVEKAFANYLDSTISQTLSKDLRMACHDSLNKWMEAGLKYVQFLKICDWKLDDAVFYNGSKDKALLLLLFQVKDSGYKYDYGKVIAAEKIEGRWQFYYASYPLLVNDRVGGQPVSFEMLAQDAREQIYLDGFFHCGLFGVGGCRVNPRYVESDVWFTDERRKMHQRFLANAMPEVSWEKAENRPH